MDADKAMVIFQPSGRRGEVPKGTNIIEASRLLGVDIEALWRAAGWDVLVVEDGNDASSLLAALEGMRDSSSGKPHVIIANTTKGKGISFMEGSLNWHARPMNQEQYDQAIADLENAKTT